MERGKLLPAMAALAIAALAGGCFQPLYGERSLTGGPALRDQLSAVEIVQIEAPKGSDEARLAAGSVDMLTLNFLIFLPAAQRQQGSEPLQQEGS